MCVNFPVWTRKATFYVPRHVGHICTSLHVASSPDSRPPGLYCGSTGTPADSREPDKNLANSVEKKSLQTLFWHSVLSEGLDVESGRGVSRAAHLIRYGFTVTLAEDEEMLLVDEGGRDLLALLPYLFETTTTAATAAAAATTTKAPIARDYR